jgi:hypothetical protein
MDRVVFLEVLLTLFVIGVQVRCFLATRRRSGILASIFPDSEPLAVVVPTTQLGPIDEKSSIESTRIQAASLASSAFNSILTSTNRYLEKNIGSPADFRILQDIAERVSDAIEQAAASNATLPLYVGLMGTFVGVIVGLGGFLGSDPEAFTDPAHLRHFVGGVLIAMMGSLCGLLFSVIGRSRYLHDAQEKNDRLKQAYFTLLQTELLPVVRRDFSSALYTLQQNLDRFNVDFRSNLAVFSTSLNSAGETLHEQRELLDLLRSADILKIVKTNAEMLRTSATISQTLGRFSEASGDLHSKLMITSELTDKLNALLSRFGLFEQSINSLGEKLAVDQSITASTIKLIYENLESLKNRTELIRQFVGSEDETIRRYIEAQRQSLENLVDGARQQLDDLAGQIARSVTNAFSDGKGTDFLNHVARLQGIDEEIRGIAANVGQMQQSGKERESAILLAIKNGSEGISPALDQHLAKLSSIDVHIARLETALARVQPEKHRGDLLPARPQGPEELRRSNSDGRRPWWRRRWWAPKAQRDSKYSATARRDGDG